MTVKHDMAQQTFRFDLHLHSCLSPCGSLDMSPRTIARRARELGLNAIALTDHQSTRNTPAFAQCCREEGLVAWFGLEMSVAEEVHVLALFDQLEPANEFGDRFMATLPRRQNDEEIFGEQVIVDAYENILDFEPQMLAIASRWDMISAVVRAREAGALVVAAHVDRPSFSVTSQLGFLTGEEGFDAVELSARAAWPAAECGFDLAGYPVLRNSDAHQLEQMGRQWNEVELERFDIASLRAALHEGRVRHGRGDPAAR